MDEEARFNSRRSEIAQTTTCANPAAPMPRTLPTTSWRAETEDSRISIRRFSFSSASPCST